MSHIIIEGKRFDIITKFIDKKNISASVENNKITLRFSDRISKSDYDKYYRLMIGRITKKIKKNIDIYHGEDERVKRILHYQKLIFNGEEFKIHFHKFKSLRSQDDRIYINKQLNIELIKKQIIKFLESYFRGWLEDYVEAINKDLGFSYNKVILKYVRSKWGHCTSENDILINLKLLNGHRDYLDYIIIHELCHTKTKNHSKSFWDRVAKNYPDFRNVEKRLKLSPPQIFL